MSAAEVDPEVTLVLEHRTASSDCCGSGLTLPPGGGYGCAACGKTCGRVLSAPVAVTAHG